MIDAPRFRITPHPVLLAALLALLAGCAAGGKSGDGEHAIQITDKGFEPAVTEVERGKPATLLVTRKEERTCATEMVFAALDTAYELPLGKTVRIVLPAHIGDTLRYACPMDMYTGIVVAK